MKNKKLNELKKEPPSLEEQQKFIDELRISLRRNAASLQQWIENFKKEHGVTDENI